MKREYYENHQKFYNEYIVDAEIVKVVEGRGTKVYYSNDDFFYLESCRNLELREGDFMRKRDTIINVYRTENNKDVLVSSGVIPKPPKTYLDYVLRGKM
jgi:hypothetical protein